MFLLAGDKSSVGGYISVYIFYFILFDCCPGNPTATLAARTVKSSSSSRSLSPRQEPALKRAVNIAQSTPPTRYMYKRIERMDRSDRTEKRSHWRRLGGK